LLCFLERGLVEVGEQGKKRIVVSVARATLGLTAQPQVKNNYRWSYQLKIARDFYLR